MKRDARWLLSEVKTWVTDGLIDERQADLIRGRYPIAGSTGWGQALITAIGAMIFGLGIILFFAYNWSEMSKFTKLALVFGALGLAHFAGILLRFSKSGRYASIEGLHVLGTMLFGAAIFLIAQIYHIDEHYPTAFLVWGLAAMALGWVLPSSIQGGMAVILLSVWGLAEIIPFDSVHVVSPVLVAAGLVSLAWIQRSNALLVLALPASIVLLLANLAHFEPELIFPLIFCCAVILISLATFSKLTNFPDSSFILIGVGSLAYGLLLFLMSNFRSLNELLHSLNEPYLHSLLWIIYGMTIAVCLAAIIRLWIINADWSNRLHLILVLCGTVLLAAYHLRPFFSLILSNLTSSVQVFGLIANLLLILHAVLLIVQGTESARWKPVTLGCSVLCVIVFLRFNTLFDSLLLRGLAFVLLGAGLFAIGHFYSRSKNRLEQTHA